MENNKPFEIDYHEAKESIYNVVNDCLSTYKIPYYLLETILSDIYHQIQAKAEENYNRQVEAYKLSQQDKNPASGEDATK